LSDRITLKAKLFSELNCNRKGKRWSESAFFMDEKWIIVTFLRKWLQVDKGRLKLNETRSSRIRPFIGFWGVML